MSRQAADLSKHLSKWLIGADGKRWRATTCIRGELLGRLDGLECNPLMTIPMPWEIEKK